MTKLNATGTALIYSTRLGGGNVDHGEDIALDVAGNAYVVGYTRDFSNPKFPVTTGAFQTVHGGIVDAFVTKLSATGTMVYSTLLGGNSNEGSASSGASIAVDTSGNAYVMGQTSSTDFPTTAGAFQTVYGGDAGGDAFVTKLNATGTALIYSTFLGGSGADCYYSTLYDLAFGKGDIAVDGNGNACVIGFTQSSNFPTTPGAFQNTYRGSTDAFVTKLNSTGTALLYSTYLGGSGRDKSNGIALDILGNAYVVGSTGSTDFPTLSLSQPLYGGSGDAFVTRLIIPTVPDQPMPTVPPTPTPGPTPILLRADVLIRNASEVTANAVGGNIYRSDAQDQEKQQVAAAQSPVFYRVQVQNDGDGAASFLVEGTAGGDGWSVIFRNVSDGSDVSSQVTGAGWPTPLLQPQSVCELQIEVMPDDTVPAYTIRNVMLSARVAGDSERDAVRAKTTLDPDAPRIPAPTPTPGPLATPTPLPAVAQPDALIRNASETSAVGNNIYNSDGARQSKLQPVAANATVTYNVLVQNDGSSGDMLRVTGTRGGNGWSVRYFDAATGGLDITAEVAGSDLAPGIGWSSGALNPQVLRELRVEVSPDASVTSDTSKEVLVHVASTNVPAREDVVKATTRKVGQVEAPIIVWGGLTDGKVRACAGGVNTFVHRVTAPVQVRQNGVALPNAQLLFSFAGNVGHDFGNGQPLKTARFLWTDAQGQAMQTPTLTLTTDDNGNTSVTILSSDVVSQPQLVAQRVNAQGTAETVGSVLCDFAAMTSKRGFPDPVFRNDPNWQASDSGWLFEATHLDQPGDTTSATLYLKFRIDPARGDVADNWRPVNGQQLRVGIRKVVLWNGVEVTDREQVQRYIAVVKPDGTLSRSVLVTSGATPNADGLYDGSARINLKAGERIVDVRSFEFAADNHTQWSN